VLRIHTTRGWLSTKAADGSELLEAVHTDDEDEDEDESSTDWETDDDDDDDDAVGKGHVDAGEDAAAGTDADEGHSKEKKRRKGKASASSEEEAANVRSSTADALPRLAGAAAEFARKIAPALSLPADDASPQPPAPAPAPAPPPAPAPAPAAAAGGASTVAMRALLERLGAIQEECNQCRQRWEEEKAAADVARNGQAQAQAEAAQIRRGLQQTIATLKKSEKSLKVRKRSLFVHLLYQK
jgi:hypothetical protein